MVTINEYLYTGRRLDPETGLQLNRNRFYASHLGRWVSRDPIGYMGSNKNLYEYVISAPLQLVDPSGLKCWIVGRLKSSTGPWEYSGSCGGVEPGLGLDPSPVDGGTVATSLKCCRKRKFTAMIKCDGCPPSLFSHEIEQEQCVTIPLSPTSGRESITVGGPCLGADPGTKVGISIGWHNIDNNADKERAIGICESAFRRKGARPTNEYTPVK